MLIKISELNIPGPCFPSLDGPCFGFSLRGWLGFSNFKACFDFSDGCFVGFTPFFTELVMSPNDRGPKEVPCAGVPEETSKKRS